MMNNTEFTRNRWALESSPDRAAEWDVDARMAEAADDDGMDERDEMDRDTTLYMLNMVRDDE